MKSPSYKTALNDSGQPRRDAVFRWELNLRATDAKPYGLAMGVLLNTDY